MSITRLDIHHLRNLTQTQFHFHAALNILHGPNGSGKTAVLEALHLLSSARSFRTRETAPLVQQGEASLMLYAETMTGENISLKKDRAGLTTVRLNKKDCINSSALARTLPCQLYYQDIFQIIDAGPIPRRKLLDWGMFHVKHTYHALWIEYQQVLKQRNALLRRQAPRREFTPWDTRLISLSHQLDAFRAAYFITWHADFQQILPQLTDCHCTLLYYRGWDKANRGTPLEVILESSFEQDRQRQYTQYGAHQADIVIEATEGKAKQFFSRGQQKIILHALKFAQSTHLTPSSIHLFDDLMAELDTIHGARLLTYIQTTLTGQKFITTTALAQLQGITMPHQTFDLMPL